MRILFKLFSFKLLLTFLGLIYSILQVRYFGTSRAIEVFFVAQTLMMVIAALTQSGQLSEVFLPEYLRLKKLNKYFAFDALNVILYWLIIFSLGVLFLIYIITPLLSDVIAPGFSESDKKTISSIFRFLLPCILFQIIKSFFINVLNAESKFGRAELIGVISTLINIIGMVFFYDKFGVWSLVYAIFIGSFFELIFYYSHLKNIGYKPKLIKQCDNFEHKIFFKAIISTLSYTMTTQVYKVVLTASISHLPEGSYAIFKYVETLASKIRSLFIQPFITLFFTTFSKTEFKSNIATKYFSTLINVNCIILIGSVLFGKQIIELLWGGSNFDSEAINIAYVFLIFNIFGIYISSLSGIYRKMAISYGHGFLLYSVWSVSQLLTAILTFYLIKNFDISGLGFIIPLNSLLLYIGTYGVYKFKCNFWYYNLNYLNLCYLSISVILSFLLECLIGSNIYDIYNLILLAVCFLTLVFYPLFSIYQVIKR